MSGLDVEALLDSTAKAVSPDHPDAPPRANDGDDRHKRERNDRRDRDRHREDSHDGDRDRKRRDRSRDRDRARRNKDANGEEDLTSPRSDRGSAHGSYKSRRRSRTPEGERRHSHRDRHRASPTREDGHRSSGGDFYRGGGRMRSRSRSPDGDRYYRPVGRGRRDDGRPRDPDPKTRRKHSRSPKPRRTRSTSPQLTEDERDRRTVFVQQLAARLRTKELIAFFEKVGPVKEAQIVKDRVSGRSKGYVNIPHSSVQWTSMLTIAAHVVLAMSNSSRKNPSSLRYSLPARSS